MAVVPNNAPGFALVPLTVFLSVSLDISFKSNASGKGTSSSHGDRPPATLPSHLLEVTPLELLGLFRRLEEVPI